MRKFCSRNRLILVLNGWYVRTRGTLSTFITLFGRIIFRWGKTITTVSKERNHLLWSQKEVTIARANATQAEKLAVRDRTSAVLRMERRKMEEVESVSVIVVDRNLNSSTRNAQGDVQKGEFYFRDNESELKCRVEVCNEVNKGFQLLSPARSSLAPTPPAHSIGVQLETAIFQADC